MGSLFGDQFEMRDQTQLFEEMKRLAVVSQKSAIFHSISYKQCPSGWNHCFIPWHTCGFALHVETGDASEQSVFVRNKNLSVVARQDVAVGWERLKHGQGKGKNKAKRWKCSSRKDWLKTLKGDFGSFPLKITGLAAPGSRVHRLQHLTVRLIQKWRWSLEIHKP